MKEVLSRIFCFAPWAEIRDKYKSGEGMFFECKYVPLYSYGNILFPVFWRTCSITLQVDAQDFQKYHVGNIYSMKLSMVALPEKKYQVGA